MASASKTPNLNLPQWVGTEKPERTDFNAAFDAIDGEVGALADQIRSNVIQGLNCNIRDANFRVIPFYQGVNTPVPDDLSILVHIPYSEDWIAQQLYAITATGLKVYYRVFHTGTAWTGWSQLNLP